MENLTTVGSKGIYHALPTFPDAQQTSIIVTGANGISGTAMVKALSESPDRWSNIYAMSRRPPTTTNPSHVHPIAVDFMKSPEDIATIFKKEGVKATYVYFASYVQPPPKEGEGLWSDTDEMDRLNLALLRNFIAALKLANITPKRFLLQTGGKYYSLHLGPTVTPEEEEDPRYEKFPNFYYPQEDMLYKYSAQEGGEWSVTRPGFILGAVQDAAMNITYPLAVYAAIQKHLGLRLEFPGDIAAWETESHLSTARLIAFHAEWALLTPEAKNQALNHSDGGVFTWGKFWPIIAGWYGLEAGVPVTDETKFRYIDMPFDAPRGFGPKGKIAYSFTFESWASQPHVLAAYDELRTKHNLKYSPFDDTKKNFGVLDAEILTPWPRSISMNRSRKLGWNGYVDTYEAIREVIGEMAGLGMVPEID